MFVAPAQAATTGDISLTGEQTIDGTPVVDGDRVLVKNQTDATENGVYVAATGAWSRASDFVTGVVDQGASIIVLNGATQADTLWVLATANPIVVGTTALEFDAVPDLSAFVTETGVETLSNKTFAGPTSFYTDGSRIGITGAGAPLASPEALVHIVNDNAVGCGLRTTSYWTGTTALPYQNNDNSLWEVHNNVESDSLNRSWAGSFANAYNSIPAGVTDSGTRVGVIGWAVSAAKVGYEHAGTLAVQIGLHGTAGFQGAGSPPGAVIVNATGVRGYIYNDSAGTVIEHARAGEFITTATTGIVEDNVAVYASAGGGTTANWAFYGNSGTLFNANQALFGSLATQSSSKVAARGVGNAYEFGHPDPGGYGSNIGATQTSGYPFVALCAEADASGNTFRTRGKPGVVIQSDLAGALVFGRITNANASGQGLTESGRFDASGNLSVIGNFSASGRVAAGGATSQSSASVVARRSGNGVEFGHSDSAGYGSNIGATFTSGFPFLALCAEADASGNTFRTRGKPGVVIQTDLTGALIFGRLTDANASGQGVTESARFDPSGNLSVTGNFSATGGITIGGNVNATGQVAAGGATSQSSASMVARKNGNGVEFGHPNAAGYASNLGGTASLGYPFLAFCAEADASGNTFRTRGKKGAVVSSDLAGSIIFSRLTDANASGQSLSESARFDANGRLVLSNTPILKSETPASAGAAGQTGEVCWDTNYLYVCVAANTWKRAALATW